MSEDAAELSSGDFAIELCTTKEALQEAYNIRKTVFHEEQGFSLECEVDEYDLISAQFLLYKKSDSSKRGLGTIRFSPYPSSGSLNKVSTPPDLPLGDPHNEAIISRRFVHAYKTALEYKPADSALHVDGRVQAGAKLGRLALLKDVRGTGAGRLLVEQAETWLRTALSHAMQGMLKEEEKEAKSFTIRLNSQMPVRGFYEKLGYQGEGDPFDEDGAPHMLYLKTIAF